MLYENNFYRKGKTLGNEKNQKRERTRKMNAGATFAFLWRTGNVTPLLAIRQAQQQLLLFYLYKSNPVNINK